MSRGNIFDNSLYEDDEDDDQRSIDYDLDYYDYNMKHIVLDYDLNYYEKVEIFQDHDLILCEKCDCEIDVFSGDDVFLYYCEDCDGKETDDVERDRMRYGKCKECFQVLTEFYCLSCARKHFQQDFDKWTSGNKNIDKLIQDNQLSAEVSNILEWIPYDKFNDIKYIAEGGFAKVHSATWTDGRIKRWNHRSNNWGRGGSFTVALKVFNNSSKNVSEDFINEVKFFESLNNYESLISCYGITQEPNTQNYALVLRFMENGTLRSYLNQNFNSLTWKKKLEIMNGISEGLYWIHNSNLMHKDLHLGNVLQNDEEILNRITCISDFGFCKPADESSSNSNSRNTYGVMPYMAPEILRGNEYTQKSDIYSFGIIMNEIISIVSPFNDESHDELLALDICRGKRPKIRDETPEFLKELIQRCWDANPENRPTSEEVFDGLNNYFREAYDELEKLEELSYDFTESTNAKLFETHPQAIYISRLLNFSNLPEPVNCPNQEEFVSSRYGVYRSECLDCAIID